MVTRHRNDNVSGRVPLSAGRATDERVEEAIQRMVPILREKRWREATKLLDEMVAMHPRCPTCDVLASSRGCTWQCEKCGVEFAVTG